MRCHQNLRTSLLNETQGNIILKPRNKDPDALAEVRLMLTLPEKKKKSLSHLMAQQFNPATNMYKDILVEIIRGAV